MKLELKHLAPYLPYGLIVNCDFKDGDVWACKMETLSEDEAYLDGCDGLIILTQILNRY